MADLRRIPRISTSSVPIALLAVHLFAFPATAIQLQTWSTVARIMSGNTTLVVSPESGTTATLLAGGLALVSMRRSGATDGVH
jgi:hypothetical protein